MPTVKLSPYDYATLERVWFLEDEDKDLLSSIKESTVKGQFLLDNLTAARHTLVFEDAKKHMLIYPVQWVLGTNAETIDPAALYHLSMREVKSSGWRCCLIVKAAKLLNRSTESK